MKRQPDVALEVFADLVGLPAIQRVSQLGRDPGTARYTFEFTDGRTVRVGPAAVLWSQTQVGRVFGVTIGYVPPLIPRDDWHNGIAALIAHAVEVTDAPDQALTEHVLDWLDQYLAAAATNDRDGAIEFRQPFIDDGEVWVSVDNFARWVRREYAEQILASDIRTALVDLGFHPARFQYNANGRGKTRRRTTARYYRGSTDLLEGAERES